jgi:chemotaxis protein CheD
MPSVEPGLPEVHVKPGETQLVEEPTILRTVLGSCVGIAYHVPRSGLAALSHPMLPACPAAGVAGMSPHQGRRYVDYTIREMARRLDTLGIARHDVTIKLFGGADVLAAVSHSHRPTVGWLNCQAAKRILAEEGFTVAASSLGGTRGISMLFHTGTGEVLVRRLPAATVEAEQE